jgi:hypothetical protein
MVNPRPGQELGQDLPSSCSVFWLRHPGVFPANLFGVISISRFLRGGEEGVEGGVGKVILFLAGLSFCGRKGSLTWTGNQLLPRKPRAKSVKEGFLTHPHEWHSAHHQPIVIKGYVDTASPTDPRPLQFDLSQSEYRIWLPPQDGFDLCCRHAWFNPVAIPLGNLVGRSDDPGTDPTR